MNHPFPTHAGMIAETSCVSDVLRCKQQETQHKRGKKDKNVRLDETFKPQTPAEGWHVPLLNNSRQKLKIGGVDAAALQT